MICKSCANGGTKEQCANFVNSYGTIREPPATTWCDSQYSKGVFIDTLVCQHRALTKEGTWPCPSCGKMINVEIIREPAQTANQVFAELEAEEGAANDG